METKKQLLVICFLLSTVVAEVVVTPKGDLFFLNGLTGKGNYEDTKAVCHQMGGVIPRIHSETDAQIMAESLQKIIIGNQPTTPRNFSLMWLSATKHNSSAQYEWEDGSPFDYSPWINGGQSCDDECCAVVLVLGNMTAKGHFMDLSCFKTNVHQVCQVNSSLEDMTKKLSEEMETSKRLKSTMLRGIDNMNQTLIQIVKRFEEKFKDQKQSLSSAKLHIGFGIVFSFFLVIAFVIFVNRKSYLRHIYREEYNML